MSALNEREEPVFIIGSGRSGTTVAYNILAAHPDFAWISNLADRARCPQLAVLNKLYRSPGTPALIRLQPSEGYRLWNHCLPRYRDTESGVLAASDVTADDRRRVQTMIRCLIRSSGSRTFLNKNTRNTRRVLFLNELFPTARFIHVIRNPLDACSSLLEVAWWQNLRLWNMEGQTPHALAATPAEEARLAAHLWSDNVRAAKDSLGTIDGARAFELRYEELVRSPAAKVNEIIKWIGMEADPVVEAFAAGLATGGSVGSFKHRLTEEQVAIVTDATARLAGELEYGFEA